jgi:hypothetical protein
MYFVLIYENRRMKPVEIVVGWGREKPVEIVVGWGREKGKQRRG